jgi:hypothetical protein
VKIRNTIYEIRIGSKYKTKHINQNKLTTVQILMGC